MLSVIFWYTQDGNSFTWVLIKIYKVHGKNRSNRFKLIPAFAIEGLLETSFKMDMWDGL